MKVKDLEVVLQYCPLCSDVLVLTSRNTDNNASYHECTSDKHNCVVKVANMPHIMASLRLFPPNSKYSLEIWGEPSTVFLNSANIYGVVHSEILCNGELAKEFEVKDFSAEDLLMLAVFR